MANTLTGLIPVIYKAADMVAREQVGFLPAVFLDAAASGAALNQNVTYDIVPAVTLSDITPGATAPTSGVMTIGTGTMTISKSKSATFVWNGEEERSVSPLITDIKNNQWTQAFRTLTNAVETDLALEAANNSSRMYGTAGTAPFGTANDLSDIAQIYKLLDDNGTPKSDRHIVYNTTASANIRGKQAVLFKVNEAGTDSMLRGGTLGSLQGFEQHESNQIASHTKGTGASYTTDTAGYAVGATAITLITGTGTVLAGDTVTFAGDTNKYTVATALTGGVVKLAEPGLRVAIATSATAMTVGNNYIPSVAFERGAIHLLTRTPLMPAGGDSATDTMVVTDPYSGLSFLVAVYPQYHQSVVEIGLAWGQKAVKRDFIATLLG